MRPVPLLLLASLACTPDPVPTATPDAAAATPTAPAAPEAAPPPTAPADASAEPELVLRDLAGGTCEASALVRVGDTWIVADNEDTKQLYVYDTAMAPRETRPLAAEVSDVEALALRGDTLVVLGSHSRNKDGEVKEKRRRILGLLDGPVSFAIDDCAPCAAATAAPQQGGFNLEGAAVLGTDLVLGARAPLDAGRALLFVLDPAPGREGRIARTIPLDLRGQGVRELAPFRGGLLVVAGPPVDADAPHTLWFLPSLDAAPVALDVTLPAYTEGLWPIDDGHVRIVVDGSGKPGACTQPSRWADVTLPPLP